METLLDFEAPFEGLATATTAEKTLLEILPNVPPKAARSFAAYLSRKGVVRSEEGETYDAASAEKIRRFADLVRGQGLSKSRACAVLTWGDAVPAARCARKKPTSESFFSMVLEVERLRAEAEAKSKESRTLLESLRSATAQMDENRRFLAELDEERKKTRARLARIEAAARTRPEGIWARLRAAWDVLTGKSAVMKALPSGEIVSAIETKAA